MTRVGCGGWLLARGDYYVWEQGGRWHVMHRGLTISFETQRVARNAASGEAYRAGQAGFGGRVLVQASDGTWNTEWVYGVDRGPTAGVAA